MDNNTGGFGSAIGGGGALKEAMGRRGIDTSILDQVSPAAGGSPVAPQLPPDVGQIAPQGLGQPQDIQAQSQGTPQAPYRSAEMQIALKALEGTVRTENKIAEATLAPKPLI